ncbi:MAG: N-acetylmuramoyl-L-alanine amidase [Myxococcota bacterium]
MRRRRAIGPLLCLLLAPALMGVERPPGLGDVTEVRHWSYPDYTRVVIELDRAVRIKREPRRLAADARADRPERLYLDLEGVWVGRRFLDGIAVRDGLLEGVRIGQNTRSSIRVVVDLQRYARHRLITLSHPDRLVLDVFGPRSGVGLPHRPGVPQEPMLPSSIRGVRTVVLDPGHGGRDPGAIGVGGIQEKRVTLAMARALEQDLAERGFRVVLTRDGDETLTLEDRTARAEAARGDLFVSLHANAAPRRSVRGVETYYLDENHERHSLTVAARENGVSRSEVNALQRTLAKLRVHEVSPLSRKLAELVQGQIVGGMPRPYGPVPDLGVKKGPFYVLFLSTMPSVLVEAGFLTNKTEAKRLRDREYIHAMAEQIAEALVQYRDSGSSLAWNPRP